MTKTRRITNSESKESKQIEEVSVKDYEFDAISNELSTLKTMMGTMISSFEKKNDDISNDVKQLQREINTKVEENTSLFHSKLQQLSIEKNMSYAITQNAQPISRMF